MKKIKLTNCDNYTLVDDDIYELYKDRKWMSTKGYAVRTENRKLVSLHRIVAGAETPDQKVDHINGDRLDNRRGNLRICNGHQNAMNQGIKSTNRSGYKGVHFRKDRNCWVAQITHNYKCKHLGSFKNIVDAVEAYNKEAKRLRGEYAFINKT